MDGFDRSSEAQRVRRLLKKVVSMPPIAKEGKAYAVPYVRRHGKAGKVAASTYLTCRSLEA